MTTTHPATQKAQLRSLLAVDLVVTTSQLERWGLLSAVGWLGLPTLTRTCRTRVTQSGSDVDLTFVALMPEQLTLAPRELMHLCGLAEIRRGTVFAIDEEWRHVTLKGRRKAHQPDAEIIQYFGPARRFDCSVEFDAGYSTQRIESKLKAAAAAGYTRIIWGTSVHARTSSLVYKMHLLKRHGFLPEVTEIETRFVDFWSRHDPYIDRPRCHKPMSYRQRFNIFER